MDKSLLCLNDSETSFEMIISQGARILILNKMSKTFTNLDFLNLPNSCLF